MLNDLTSLTNALDAEMVGIILVSGAGAIAGGDADAALRGYFLPAIESVATPEAAVMLAAIAAVAEPDAARAARAGLGRLVATAVTPPDWITQLTAPSTVADCRVLRDPERNALVLTARFNRAESSVGVLVLIEPDHCGAAAEISLVDAAELPTAFIEVHAAAAADGVTLIEEALDPAEFRWEAEIALDARDLHDRDDREDADELADLPEDGEPPYDIVAHFLRTRLRTLPRSDKPKPRHGEGLSTDNILAALSQMTTWDKGHGGNFAPPRRRATRPALPPRRKSRDGRAPTLQLRVDLRYASPPIWRRLEVPGDITLRALHSVLQVAFSWENSHLYSFDTGYGDFGQPDAELGIRSDQNVTLEQVAGGPGDKLTYTYDFGDDWQHIIAVEESTPAYPSAKYPRCTGGRRAAPPEDCGGIPGYEHLLDILADPDHAAHDDQLEWLGLADAGEFDPAAFDKQAINTALARRP
jgi:hypothetical protein